MELDPAWTEAGSWSLGRDPLGMQATSVRLYRKLLPGLTNVTNRLRYYSFYTWVVRAFGRTQHSTVEEKWGRFIRRAEALYALASFRVDRSNSLGLGGGDWAGRMSQALPSRIALRDYTDRHDAPGQYLGAVRGNFGQFYIASMVEVGLLSLAGRIPFVTHGYGAEMADAFEASASEAIPLIEAAILDGELSLDELTRIGEIVHPSRIPPGSNEMTLLRRYLYDDVSIPGAAQRRASAWLVLDLMRLGVRPGDESAFRRAFYNRIVDNKPYGGSGATLDRWRAYQANEFAHVALEFLLNELMRRLASAGEAAPRTLIGDLLAEPLGALAVGSARWADWADAIALDHFGEEEEIAAPILRALAVGDRQGAPDLVEAAIRLIATLWGRWTQDSGSLRAEVAAASEHGRSFAGLLVTLERNADLSVAEALTAAIGTHVISGHLAVAGRKLAASGNFTYHFRSEDGLLSSGRPAAYGYTNPRLRTLIGFLADAGLHQGSQLTAAGERFVRDRKAD